MAFLSKRYGVYYIVWEDDARKRHFRSTKTKLKADALSVLRRFCADGNEYQDRRKIYLQDFINVYFNSIEKVFESTTIRVYRSTLKIFLEFIGTKYMHQINSEDISNYLNQRRETCNDTTINIHIKILKAFFHRAQESNYIYSDWYKKIRRNKIPERTRIPISKNDINVIIEDAAEPVMKEIIMYGYMTGARRSEIINQTWENIDFRNMEIKISNTDTFHTKSKENRLIPINNTLAEMLREKFYREQIINRMEYVFRYHDRKINAEHVTKYFRKILKRNGFDKRVTFHSLRHSFISNLISSGTDINTVKELAGHSDITTTAQYIHTTSELKRKAVEML
jgi:site-specific recombinase XerD